MRFNNSKPLFAILVLLAVGVNSHAQRQIEGADMPEQWQYTSAFDQSMPTQDGWWREFNDPVLDSLIILGESNNYDVLMAQRRIEIANQAVKQAQAAYFPQLGVSGGWTKTRASGMNAPVAGHAQTGSYFDFGVSMNWQIDMFGKIYSRTQESKATFRASRAEYAGMMVTVSAKIASAYFQLRTVQEEIEVLNRHIASQKKVTVITEARHEAGLASMLDVNQARTTYYSTLASIAALKSTETATINTLAVLLGVFPAEIDIYLREPAHLPDYHKIVAVGVPMELIRRRPDIAQAEYQLAGYAAAIGVAKKDFLPTISLTGTIGTSAHNISDTFTNPSFTYSIAPTLSWTLFDGLSRKAALASAREQMQAGIDNYNLTLVTAVQEVETAMSTYVNDMEYIDYLDKVVNEAHESLVMSIDLYKQGLSPFINVTNSQITLLQYANQLVVARGQALNDLVSLYQALGGGWCR